MRHERHYTLAQATAALDWVSERLERMRDARERLNDEEAREALSEAGPTNGGGEAGRVITEAILELRAALVELRAVEVVLRDLERGLVDFPSLRDGEEIYLCWVEAEEDHIAHWHPLDAGFAGRQPL
jgi:hypothetical protein